MKITLIESTEDFEKSAGISSMYRDLIKAYYDMIDRLTSSIVTLKEIGQEDGIEELQKQIIAIDDFIEELNARIDDEGVLEITNESAKQKRKKKTSNVNYVANAGDVPKNVEFFNHITSGPDAASIGTADQVLSMG